MDDYKEGFIEFLAKTGAVKFGRFELKSGRISPYFISTGMFNRGDTVSELGRFYAESIKKETGGEFDLVFGPAYKGIPISVSTAIALSAMGMKRGFAFDRKEAKDHGERESLIGPEIKDGTRVVIVDDVITSGKSLRFSADFLSAMADVDIVSAFISVDRKEKGTDGRSAIEEIRDRCGMEVKSIVTINEIIEYLHKREIGGKVYVDDETKKRTEEYLEEYGVR